ncbi:ParA family protein [Limibaculum sp. FT325]|uniref:ParA family protein n=1 Tax=Thermohalobaculum sediminis TaxID=2939436 RepID=UPI0020BEB137|nr:ParA family protein [Limibaculum sediminis]MCL5775723.1 ParA family protein [Limibaculum sediminis]
MQTVLIANRKGGVGKTLVAVTLASALAARGARVTLADADRQQSAMGWLARRPATAPAIRGVSWEKAGDIGETPKKTDWLVIDAPGALRGNRAEALIAEARAVVVPVQPGVFDLESTTRFLDEIDEIKRVRKGKVALHLLVNRVRAQSRAGRELEAALAGMGRAALAWIPERTAHAELAAQGLGAFDARNRRRSRALEALQAQWAPLLAALGEPV